MSASKGLEINLIGYLIIGIAGITILLLFVSGPLTTLMRGTFCYFYTNILQQKSDYCKITQTGPEFQTISPNSQDELARDIAAYAIRCWQDERPIIKKQMTCFNLNLAAYPGTVYEYNVTKIMETEGGCNILENSQIINENGTLVRYSGNCGSKNNLLWQVSGNAITDQQLILIIYDATLDKIIVQA
jgi:hypothetical protein